MLIGDIPRLNSRRFPGKVALICGDRELTWDAVDDRANRLGAWLLRQGLRRGDRVAVLAPSIIEWPEVSFGISKAGLVLVPMNVRLTAPEISYLLQDSGARAMIFHTSLAELASKLIGADNDVEHTLEIGGSGAAPGYDAALADSAAADPSPPGLTPDDLRVLIYTSGTTGLPKAVQHTHRTMIYGALDHTIADRAVSSDRMISGGPFFTSGGCIRMVNWSILGQTTIILPRFDVEAMCDAARRYRATGTIMVPTMLQRLVSYLEEGHSADLSSLSRIGYGSAPASVSLIRRVRELTGVELWQRYGQSEVAGFVTTLTPEDHRLMDQGRPEIAKSCGRESAYVDLRIVSDAGDEVATGEIGEITIRCDAVSPGYWNKPELTAERFRDGALYTGDLAYRDEDGYVYLVDRKNDLIISGAFNIYPGELERVIARHPGVQSVAVFGVPHPEWGETPHAALVRHPGWAGSGEDLERELRELCRAELAGYKQPNGFSFHEGFPVSAAGKVVKRDLRQIVVPQ